MLCEWAILVASSPETWTEVRVQKCSDPDEMGQPSSVHRRNPRSLVNRRFLLLFLLRIVSQGKGRVDLVAIAVDLDRGWLGREASGERTVNSSDEG